MRDDILSCAAGRNVLRADDRGVIPKEDAESSMRRRTIVKRADDARRPARDSPRP